MSKADEMFKELGYTKVFDTDIEIRYSATTRDGMAEISFWKKTRNFDLIGFSWSMLELQAINEKCKELNWL